MAAAFRTEPDRQPTEMEYQVRQQSIHLLWRPQLRNPDDEMVLELAVAAGCDHIVTYNKKDFAEARRFGLRVTTPREFLKLLGEIP